MEKLKMREEKFRVAVMSLRNTVLKSDEVNCALNVKVSFLSQPRPRTTFIIHFNHLKQPNSTRQLCLKMLFILKKTLSL